MPFDINTLVNVSEITLLNFKVPHISIGFWKKFPTLHQTLTPSETKVWEILFFTVFHNFYGVRSFKSRKVSFLLFTFTLQAKDCRSRSTMSSHRSRKRIREAKRKARPGKSTSNYCQLLSRPLILLSFKPKRV